LSDPKKERREGGREGGRKTYPHGAPWLLERDVGDAIAVVRDDHILNLTEELGEVGSQVLRSGSERHLREGGRKGGRVRL